jgi:hypothetical protein
MSLFKDFASAYIANVNPALYQQRSAELALEQQKTEANILAKTLTEQLFGRAPTGPRKSKPAADVFNEIKSKLSTPDSQQQIQRSQSPFADIIASASAKNDIPESIINRLIGIESNFDPNAVSPTGPQGLMQMSKAAAIDAGIDPNMRFDPKTNIIGGTNYLRQMLDRFGPEKAFQAYNQGPTSVANGQSTPEGIAYQNKFKDLLPMLADSGQSMPDVISNQPAPPTGIDASQAVAGGGSKFLPNPMEGGSGILGNDMDPMRRSWVEMLRNAFASGDPLMMQFALQNLGPMMEATMQDIERTSAQKNIASTNLIPGSEEFSKLMEKAVVQPGSQINVNTGDSVVKVADLKELIDSKTGQPLAIPPGITWDELHARFPDAVVKGPGITEQQSKDLFFGQRAMQGHDLINKYTEEGDRNALAAKNILSRVPIVGDAANAASRQFYSKATQLLDAGTINFIAAINYKQSGANITDTEWRNAFDSYIPVAGDTPEVRSWKSDNRQKAIEAIFNTAGPGGKQYIDKINTTPAKNNKEWKPGDGPEPGLFWED